MIFICYRKDDTGDFAQHLASQLMERFGKGSVFIDRDGIDPGDEWRAEIESALSKAVVLLALIGPHWLTTYDEYGQRRIDRADDVLVRELLIALHRRIPIIPIYVHGVKPLPAKALPERIIALADQQGIACADIKDITPVLSALEDRLPGAQGQSKESGSWGIPPSKPDYTGRENEATSIKEAVESKGVRVVLIYGLPGTGKTEMALHIAEVLRQSFPDGGIFCDLRGFKDDPLTPAQAARSVLLWMNPGLQLPQQEEQVFAHYFSALSGKRILLLFDDAKDATQFERLLPPTPAVILVTSRRRIDIAGAHRVHLDRMSTADAVSFLRKLDGRVAGAEDRVAEACGCLPLALRLAASALDKRPSLDLDEYIELLKHAATRTRYLPALQVQFDLLTEKARPRLTALAVFQNGFTDKGACAVWGLGTDEGDCILVDLYELSLIEWLSAKRRYKLHDIVRQFAADVTKGCFPEGTEQRHLDYVHQSTHDIKEQFLKGGTGVAISLASFDELINDIAGALEWASAHVTDSPRVATSCADLAWECWYLFDYRQGLRALAPIADIGLKAARAAQDDNRTFAHMRRKGFVEAHLDPQSAVLTLEACLTHARMVGNRREEGFVLGYFGLAKQKLKMETEAHKAFVESLSIAREQKNERQTGIALGRLANIEEEQGKLAEAATHYEEALAVERGIGDRPGNVIDAINCGRVYEKRGRNDEAATHYAAAAQIAKELGDARELSALAFLYDLHSRTSDIATASTWHEQFRVALEIAERSGRIYLGGMCTSLNDDQKWNAACVVAESMMRSNPSEVIGWTEKAYAVRRMPSGGIPAATEVLEEARRLFPKAWIVPYNLACYAAQTDHKVGAMEFLKEAIRVSGDAQAVKTQAASDTDLQRLEPDIDRL